MKIRTKLGLTYLSVSLLALGFISAFIYFYVKKSLTEEVLNHLRHISSIQSQRIEGIIEQNLERIRLVSSRTQLRISLDNYLSTGDKSHLEKEKLIINDAMESISSFSSISILSKNGRTIVSTDPKKENLNYSNHDFYPVALQENNARYFFLDENNVLKLYLSGPLTIDDKLIGVLLIESEANNIISLLSGTPGIHKTAETTLGRKVLNGNYIEYLTPLRFDKDAALHRRVIMSDHLNPTVHAITKKQELLTRGVDYRGEAVLAATNYIERTGWGMVVKLDEAEAFALINELVKYFAILTLVVMFIVMWVSYAFANIISKPIVALTEAAHKIDDGDLLHRAVIQSNDEVGELAGSFNNMTNNLILTQHDLENTNKELQSHRDHLEEKVAQRTQELEAIIHELESFSYSVSHDLRSPLRAIDGFSAILKEDYDDLLDDEGKLYFSRIRNASQRMGSLIDDLLELSRINRGEISRKEINLSTKVMTTIARLNQVDTNRNIEFVVRPDIHINGDDTLMEVVVNNLVGNAWKYTEKSDPAKIEFGEIKNNGQPVYFIKDNGIGFDMQYADKLFGAFQRLVDQDEYPGTGIGLASVYRAINRHGGKIWAEGEPGKGATFYFTVAPS